MFKGKSTIAAFAAVAGSAGLLLTAVPAPAHTDAELQEILEQWRDNDDRDNND